VHAALELADIARASPRRAASSRSRPSAIRCSGRVRAQRGVAREPRRAPAAECRAASPRSDARIARALRASREARVGDRELGRRRRRVGARASREQITRSWHVDLVPIPATTEPGTARSRARATRC
jgi:hypothetical protein